MKKSVMLMVGILAVALAGSAQATGTPMFAVQDNGGNDQMVVDQTGWIGIGTNAPVTPFHVKVSGETLLSAGFTFEYTNPRISPAPQAFTAPNFTFTRNNDASINSGLPRDADTLGVLNFGTVVGTTRVNSAVITAKADGAHSPTAQPSTLIFMTQPPATGILTEKMRVTATGNVGIGTSTPTSVLQVVGLPVFADNTAATTGGGNLTAGAFYRTPTGQLMVAF
jgi:hypothetical protein